MSRAEDDSVVLPKALVDYGREVGLICKQCGNGMKLCKCIVGEDTCLTCGTAHERGSGCPRGCAGLRDAQGEWY